MSLGTKLIIKWIDSTSLEEDNTNIKDFLGSIDGVLIPGGFGQRGIDGMIKVCEYCRIHYIPFFGICLGMQVAVIEYCRNVLGIMGATSEEFGGSGAYVVNRLETEKTSMGGTMHLGLDSTLLTGGTHVHQAYGDFIAYERHRHRYGVGEETAKRLEDGGLIVSGRNNNNDAIVVELWRDTHPFYLACQFHPEYKTRPLNPSPLFMSFIEAVWKNKTLT
jgi:CTP synthase